MKKSKFILALTAGIIMTIAITTPILAVSSYAPAIAATEKLDYSEEITQQTVFPYPTDIQLIQQGGRNVLHKTFTVYADYDPEKLVEPPFTQGGYRYRSSEIMLCDSTPARASKDITESKTVGSDTNDREILLAMFGNRLPYSDDDGFTGELYLLPESLAVTETGQSNYTYTVSDVRRIEGLASNDMANVPKSVVKNGLTLPLQSVDWQETIGETMGYSTVPAGYTAVAHYSAPTTGTKVAGYIATASFSGEVVKELVGINTYTIVYEGEQIIIPFNFIPLLIVGLIISCCLVACIVLWRLRKNVEVYVFQAGVPEFHTKLRLSYKKPIIDLRQLSDVEIRLIFDKHFSKKLLDQRVFVVSKYKNSRFDLNGARVIDLWLPGEKEDDKT